MTRSRSCWISVTGSRRRDPLHRWRARRLKLVGFSIWARRDGNGRSVTFPARQFFFHGDKRNFALLRGIRNQNAQDRVRDLVLRAYEQQAHNSVQAAP